MPELPEVETTVAQLRPIIEGKSIEKIIVFWNRTLNGDAALIDRVVSGSSISVVKRRGKYICLQLGNSGWLTIHLRMTGKLLYCTPATDHKHTRAIIKLSGNCTLHFVDSRKFGRITWWPAGKPLLPSLGPDPLGQAVVFSALSGLTSKRAIKTLLLDQHILAGIGNIYADESLFAAGIHPQTPLDSLPAVKIKKLSQAIPRILRAAIAKQGTTLSDYRSPRNQIGSNQFHLKVYGQTGKPCSHCGTPIEKMKVNGRGTHYCPTCQVN
jgi:formamidopyrimidine-DNA glycosylase